MAAMYPSVCHAVITFETAKAAQRRTCKGTAHGRKGSENSQKLGPLSFHAGTFRADAHRRLKYDVGHLQPEMGLGIPALARSYRARCPARAALALPTTTACWKPSSCQISNCPCHSSASARKHGIRPYPMCAAHLKHDIPDSASIWLSHWNCARASPLPILLDPGPKCPPSKTTEWGTNQPWPTPSNRPERFYSVMTVE